MNGIKYVLNRLFPLQLGLLSYRLKSAKKKKTKKEKQTGCILHENVNSGPRKLIPVEYNFSCQAWKVQGSWLLCTAVDSSDVPLLIVLPSCKFIHLPYPHSDLFVISGDGCMFGRIGDIWRSRLY